jgi:hypothetical protein
MVDCRKYGIRQEWPSSVSYLGIFLKGLNKIGKGKGKVLPITGHEGP